MQRTNSAVWLENYQRWQIKVQKDGERRSFYSNTPGRKGQREANAKADAWLENDVADDRQRVKDLWDRYKAMKEETTSMSNAEKLDADWRLYCSDLIGKKMIRKLTENDLQTCIDRAYADRKLSYKTLSNLRSTLTGFITYCRRRLHVTQLDPELTIPSGAKKGERRILQPESLVKLFSSEETTYHKRKIQDPHIHAYRFAVITGLRPGELLGLTVGDRQGNTLRMQRAVNVRGQETTGKNDNARRVFSLSPRACAEWDAQLALLEDPKDPKARMFPFVSEKQFYDCWRRYQEANGIPHISLYELRHTFVSVVKYLPEGEVKAIVGHSAAMDTWGVYSHTLEGDNDKAAKDVGELFEKILTKEKS